MTQAICNGSRIFPVLVLFGTTSVCADHLSALGLVGVPASAIAGNWPTDAQYSWVSHRFPEATIWHSWRLHPGSDGGVVFDTEQPPTTLTAEFLMFNVPTTLYSVQAGVSIDGRETLNMANLRKRNGNTTYDLGSGNGVNPEVPLVTDITQLAPGENGWQLNADGSYHVIYNTVGNCDGCRLLIHFYGAATTVTANGDVDGNGRVDAADLLLIERHLSGATTLSPGQIARGDLAPASVGDGQLTPADLYLVARKMRQ